MSVFLTPSVRRIHCLGIGGIGMSAIAEILSQRGYIVSGSEQTPNAMTSRLEKLGIKVLYHEGSSQLAAQADLVVYSAAITATHPELRWIKALGITTVSRGRLLGELMQGQYGIAVAGTHGKTSTVGLISQICIKHKLDPTIAIGGYLENIQSNVRVGKSTYFITEGDESDASLLFLKPKIAVLTNVDKDHLETYGGDFNQLIQTYQQFLSSIESDASTNAKEGAILCQEDPIIREMQGKLNRPFISYGFDKASMVRGIEIKQVGRYLHFTVLRKSLNQSPLKIQLFLSGKHNVLNALAAIAVATLLHIPDEHIQAALQTYRGIARRFQVIGEIPLLGGAVPVIDDYGHHPTEIAATIEAIKATWPHRRIVMVFQPHRYTRIRNLLTSFAHILGQSVEHLFLLPIYAASETPIEDINSKYLANVISQQGYIKPLLVDNDTLFTHLDNYLQKDDILLFQGAGDITHLAHAFVKSKNLMH